MMRGVVSSALVFSFLLIGANITIMCGATNSESVSVEIIDFDSENGKHFTNTISLNGSMNFDGFNHSWQIVDLFDVDFNDDPKLLLSGQYLDSIIPVVDGMWQWNMNANITGISCTCKVIISSSSSTNDRNIIHSSSLLVYLGDQNINHHPYILYDSISNEKIDESNYSITFSVITPKDASSESITLLNTDLILNSHYCQAPSNVCLDTPNPVNLNHTYEDNELTVFINQNELLIADGFWQFDFSLKDQFLRESNYVSSTLVLDITPPKVEITANQVVKESEPFLVYANVDDFFIGSQLTLTWTITDPDGNSRGLLSEEAYHNSTIELMFEKSGYWDVQVLVRDSANYIVIENITIQVDNIVPIIDLDLDGLSVSQGDELFISEGSSWILNATDSYDSSSDIDSLKFEWYLDDVKLDFTGSTLTDRDIEILGNSEIKLVVFDDDQASDNLSFSLDINQINQDDSSSNVVFIIGSGLFVIAIIIALILFIRRDSTSIEVPKWNSKN